MKKRFSLSLTLLLLLSGCGEGDGKSRGKGGDRPRPLVKAETATAMPFVDRIKAVGTANANEQVTLAAPVTERLVSLNFDDGSFIRNRQPVAVLATGQENAQLAEAQARAWEARHQLGRIATLRERGFASRSSLNWRLTQFASSPEAVARKLEAQLASPLPAE